MERAPTVALVALFLVLPFEPVRPVFQFLVGHLSLLEAAAAAVIVVLLWSGRGRLAVLLRERPWPLCLLWAFAAASVLSATLAPDHRLDAARFSMRAVAAAVFASAVAVAPLRACVQALGALVVSTTAVALLAMLEAVGVTALDPFLDRFRDSWVVVGMARRATAASAHPNLAAGLLASGLIAAAALWARRGETDPATWRRALTRTLPLGAVLSLGLLATYSRGGLLAAGVGLTALIGVLAWRFRVLDPAATVALLALASCSVILTREGSALRMRLVRSDTSWYGARYETLAAPGVLGAGAGALATVRVTNAGRQTWARDGAITIGYRLLDRGGRQVGGGYGPALPQDVRTGESVVLKVRLKAPRGGEAAVLVWDMAQRGVDWFSRLGVRPGVMHLAGETLPSATATADRAAAVPRPSRADLWSLALGMWRERPLLGYGPDNFRRLAGRRAGWDDWDTRTHANSTYLETAATVGLAGLVPLVGAFVSSAIASGRALRRRSGAVPLAAWCLATTAAMAAHGLVDHLLAFTAHSLLLAFLAGASSAVALTPSEAAR